MAETINAAHVLNNLVKNTVEKIFNLINSRKHEVSGAIAKLQDAANDLEEFIQNLRDIHFYDSVSLVDAERALAHLNEMLSRLDVIEMPVEQFEGYCDRCGKEMSISDNVFVEDEGILCIECASRE